MSRKNSKSNNNNNTPIITTNLDNNRNIGDGNNIFFIPVNSNSMSSGLNINSINAVRNIRSNMEPNNNIIIDENNQMPNNIGRIPYTVLLQQLQAKDAQIQAQLQEKDALQAQLQVKEAQLQGQLQVKDALQVQLQAKEVQFQAQLQAKEAQFQAQLQVKEALQAQLQAKEAQFQAQLHAKEEQIQAKEEQIQAKEMKILYLNKIIEDLKKKK